MDWKHINIYNILLAYLSEDKAEEATEKIVDYLENPESYAITLEEKSESRH